MQNKKNKFSLLFNDKLALVSSIFLVLILFTAIFGPLLTSDLSTKMNLRLRNLPPFSLEHGFMYIFGADALGRSMVARLIIASQNTMFIAGSAVFISMSLGGVLGLISGYYGGSIGNLIMRLADIIMSFPSLLLAVIVLYIFEPGLINLIMVLAFTRMPVYMRTARAEVLEIRERLFVSAAVTMGASNYRIVFKHIAPLAIPTLLTIATLDFAFVMLGESALSFLGVGIQPPSADWASMVRENAILIQYAQYDITAGLTPLIPAAAIALLCLAINFVVDWYLYIISGLKDDVK